MFWFENARKAPRSIIKEISFPDVRNFAELFEAPTGVYTTASTIRVEHAEMAISNSVVVNGPKTFRLYAAPRARVVRALEKVLVVIKDDTIFFDIIIRNPNEALVVAKYSRILGVADRWLGFIDPKSIPHPIRG